MPSTLLLDTQTWDLVVDNYGNIAVADEPYALAQDAASACRLFRGELWYDTSQGVPYWQAILGQMPPLAYIKAQLAAAASSVPNVRSAQVFIANITQDRLVSGQVQITGPTGQIVGVNFASALQQEEQAAAVAGELAVAQSANIVPVIPQSTGPGFNDPDFLNLYNALSTLPSLAQQAAMVTLITSLKAAGVWQLLDLLYIFAAPTAQGALLNWKSPGLYTAVPVNTPFFTPNRGFTNTGSSYIDTTFIPSTNGVKFTRDGAHIASRSLSVAGINSSNSLWGMKSLSDASWALIVPLENSSGIQYNLNDKVFPQQFANSTSQGHFVVNRINSRSVQVFLNGSVLGFNNSTNSTGVNSDSLILGAYDAFRGTLQIASACLGGALTTAQAGALYAAEHAYMQVVGAAQ